MNQQSSSTFRENMKLPVHRWFRFSAGFSAAWAESVIWDRQQRSPTRVLDPFAGSGTTLIAAENMGAESYGIEAHPFLTRIARAKLARRSDPETYRQLIRRIRLSAERRSPDLDGYPALVRKCYDDATLSSLDALRQAVEHFSDGSLAAELGWLTLIGILRKVSHVNTAQWQYILPRKSKKRPLEPFTAFDELGRIIYNDMLVFDNSETPHAHLVHGDARTGRDVPDGFATLVVSSPPYPNNYDYADATRLEMSFVGEVSGWGDLQRVIRRHLVRSCSQHVPEKAVDLDMVLDRPELQPIQSEIAAVCRKLARVRLTRGGRKTYHLMVACYFLDLAQTWHALRRICASPCEICFVVGDSAPYGIYVPVFDWLGKLAVAAGFTRFRFERTRDRNVKWKNRKHRVPLCEGRLWIEG